MGRARRVRFLITRAQGLLQQGGDAAEAFQMLDEAIEVLRTMEEEALGFRDLLSQAGRG